MRDAGDATREGGSGDRETAIPPPSAPPQGVRLLLHHPFRKTRNSHGDAAMLVGYARTSTNDQHAGLDAQKRDLAAAGCERIFDEQVSSVARRDKLGEAIQYLRDGDVLVVTKLDRLARSVADLVTLVAEIERRGASLRILAMNLDTHTPTGKLMLNMIGSVAQFEREIMLERQREGIQKAKADGKYKGRKPTVQAKREDIVALMAAGMSTAGIARELKIARSSVYRVMEEV